MDPSNGTLKGTQAFSHEGLTGSIGDTPEEAIIKTLDYAKISMDDFVNENFKIQGTIVQVESTKKDKALILEQKEVYRKDRSLLFT